MDVVSAAEFEATHDMEVMPRRYREWREGEGIPVHRGLAVENVNEVETGPWDRTGERGALLNLYGTDGVNDVQVHELTPAGETSVQRHLYEEIVYVTEGTGIAVIGEGDNERMFEWEQHSLFFIPYNTPYKFVNTSDTDPARLASQTYLPQLLTMILDDEIIFECENDLWEKYDAEDYYGEGEESDSETAMKRFGGYGGVIWEANFVPDVNAFEKVSTWRNQPGGLAFFYMPQTSMFAHIFDFPTGTYKKAHRHGPGAHLFFLNGEGYSLFWEESKDTKVRIDWGPWSVTPPPALWFHHHFNTAAEPVRSMALHYPNLGSLRESGAFDTNAPENEIPYVDEEPGIRELYREEVEANGVEFRMPDAVYTDPDYEW